MCFHLQHHSVHWHCVSSVHCLVLSVLCLFIISTVSKWCLQAQCWIGKIWQVQYQHVLKKDNAHNTIKTRTSPRWLTNPKMRFWRTLWTKCQSKSASRDWCSWCRRVSCAASDDRCNRISVRNRICGKMNTKHQKPLRRPTTVQWYISCTSCTDAHAKIWEWYLDAVVSTKSHLAPHG